MPRKRWLLAQELSERALEEWELGSRAASDLQHEDIAPRGAIKLRCSRAFMKSWPAPKPEESEFWYVGMDFTGKSFRLQNKKGLYKFLSHNMGKGTFQATFEGTLWTVHYSLVTHIIDRSTGQYDSVRSFVRKDRKKPLALIEEGKL